APRKYNVTSYSEIPDRKLHPRERTQLLEVPASISPAVRDLARLWAKEATDSNDVISRALEFFRAQGFRYSLAPGEYRGNSSLDEFLFRRRIGFCEHYAASFATLMRLAGIPSRVVVGYL